MSEPQDVVFFDLFGTLVEQSAGAGYALRPGAEALLPAGARLGLIANAGPYQTGRDLERIVEQVGLLDRVDPGLVAVGTNLPFPFPDRRAFGVAAALAETPIERCLLVSSDTQLLVAAARAGMRTVFVPRSSAGAAAQASPTPLAVAAAPVAEEAAAAQGAAAPAPAAAPALDAEVVSEQAPASE